jgi:hypothetical protein
LSTSPSTKGGSTLMMLRRWRSWSEYTQEPPCCDVAAAASVEPTMCQL